MMPSKLCNAFDVDVDHALPIVDREIVELADRHDAGIVDEHIESPEAFLCARDQQGDVLASRDVNGYALRLAARVDDASAYLDKLIGAACAKDELRAPSREVLRRGLADAAARARDGDYLACDHDRLYLAAPRATGLSCIVISLGSRT